MITQLHAENFKSWQDTGQIRMAPLTGFFGPNSSGKTAILQLLLMLKQTIESSDRQRVLHTGDDKSYVNLGTFSDIVHKYKHQSPGSISFSLNWQLPKLLEIADPEGEPNKILFSIASLGFAAYILELFSFIEVESFFYSFNANNSDYKFGMQSIDILETAYDYKLIDEGYNFNQNWGGVSKLPPPIKSYGFPDSVNAYYQNASFLSDLVLAFEKLFQNVYYLGPLREYPYRSYSWAGNKPQDVGRRGELTIPALLATRKSKQQENVEQQVAEWLRELGLIYDFRIAPIAENRQDYEVRVRRSPGAYEVLITDVGFGVSQILPVLVLCYYVPVGSTIILEQPEIHLHPSVQAGLADVFIHAIKTRNVQIILESHSEHLLRRLQRRIAEEQLSNEAAALYFCQTDDEGVSQLTSLQLDTFGNINNWPDNFFGDEFGELAAQTEAEMRRRMEERVR